jgi:hypothetical protein
VRKNSAGGATIAVSSASGGRPALDSNTSAAPATTIASSHITPIRASNVTIPDCSRSGSVEEY